MSGLAAFPVVAETALGYERSRTPFAPGQALRLDEAYRLAHLPLVAPGHPRVIPRLPGRAYEMGRHPDACSLVLPVDADLLEASEPFRALRADIMRQPFAPKIAWKICEGRRDKLHATLCGSLPPRAAKGFSDAERRVLAGTPALRVEMRGLFSGNINLGRLYLKLYPEERAGVNSIRALQRSLGWRESDLYLVGWLNLIDDLDAAETASLAALIARWWDRPLLRLEVPALWLLAASDDLVLDGRVIERAGLAARAPGTADQAGGSGIR